MRNQEWYPALPQLHPLDLPQLVLRLLARDAVDGEAALGVVDEAEVLACLLDRDDVHEAGWVGWVGAHFAVNFDEALHYDCLGFAGVEGVFEAALIILSVGGFGVGERGFLRCFLFIPIPDEDDQGHAVPQFVWTRTGFRSVGTAQFVEQPVRWRCQTLLVLADTSLTHLCGGVVEAAVKAGAV